MADAKAEVKTARQLLDDVQKAKADAIAKEDVLLKQLREDDLVLVKKLIIEHRFTATALRSTFAASKKAATPRKSTPRKKPK